MEIFCEDTALNISPKYLRPGFAFGGSCLPKDLRSLLYLARAESIDVPLLSGALASNRLTIDEAIDRVVGSEGFRVALLGLSFKPGSDDLRESPYVDLAETLLGKGYEVRIYDPSLNPSSLIGTNRKYVESRLPHLKRILTNRPEEALSGADTAIVSHATPEVVLGPPGLSPVEDHRSWRSPRTRDRDVELLRRSRLVSDAGQERTDDGERGGTVRQRSARQRVGAS